MFLYKIKKYIVHLLRSMITTIKYTLLINYLVCIFFFQKTYERFEMIVKMY